MQSKVVIYYWDEKNNELANFFFKMTGGTFNTDIGEATSPEICQNCKVV